MEDEEEDVHPEAAVNYPPHSALGEEVLALTSFKFIIFVFKITSLSK